MLAYDEAFERSRRDAEDDDREDAQVVQHFARITDPHSLIVTLRGMANHNRELADAADARGEGGLANHLRSRAWAMDDMVEETALWMAHHLLDDVETEPDNARVWAGLQ